MKVTCERCGHKFSPKEVRIVLRYDEDLDEVVKLKTSVCPKCGITNYGGENE